MKNLLLFILKCVIGFGVMYGAIFMLGVVLTWAENHLVLFLIVAVPIVSKIIWTELKKF